MTPKTTQEKKCICPPYKIGYFDRCPLYTPPAQEEEECDHPRSHTIHYCTKCHKNTPPQPKEPETWEEKLEKQLHTFIAPARCTCCKMMGNGHSMAYLRIDEIKEFIKQELTTTRLSAAAEERKRVCEEMKKKVEGMKKENGVYPHSELYVAGFNTGFNEALKKVISLIENIKSSV